jgi:hypothetical protein
MEINRENRETVATGANEVLMGLSVEKAGKFMELVERGSC